MKLGIMQPYFFPYIGYYQLISAVDKFVLLDDVNFIKKGWINRNYIQINGKPFLFTVPLKKISQNKLIKELYLDDMSVWRKKLMKRIENSYKNSPYFKSVFELIDKIISNKNEMISDFIYFSICEVIKYLNIKTEIVKSSSIYHNNDLKGQNRILDICLKEGAKQYVNAINGKSLYSKDVFFNNGININFIKTIPLEYKSIQDSSDRSLSIIHLMMNYSVYEIDKLLKAYELE